MSLSLDQGPSVYFRVPQSPSFSLSASMVIQSRKKEQKKNKIKRKKIDFEKMRILTVFLNFAHF
jgi:hypothetical protein